MKKFIELFFEKGEKTQKTAIWGVEKVLRKY